MSASSPAYPRIAVVDIPGKGKGVIALQHIRRGTRIVAEKPRIRVPRWQNAMLRRPLDFEALSSGDKEFFLSFPAGERHGPIVGRLRHLVPCCGADDEASGLFETVSRMNHTCYSPLARPNALYTWVEELGVEVVYAAEDIAENEEITVSYIQPVTHIRDPVELLHTEYEFDCLCPGCRRPRSERLQSLKRVKEFVRYSEELPQRMVTSSAALSILQDIERNMLAICAEGYTSEISGCAHDAFQLCAFYGNAASAARWEVMAREMHRVLHGTDQESYVKSNRLVVNPRSFREWNVLGMGLRQPKKLRGPNAEVIACFKAAIWGTGPTRCASLSCANDGAATSFKRCKPCMDKLGLDIFYCSSECQVADWKAGHKAACGKRVAV